MESMQPFEFDLVLMNKMEMTSPSKSGLMSSDDIYGPFSDDLLLNDDFVGIDLLADLDECEKNYLEELQQITERIDLPLYDIVTGNDTGCTNFSTQKSMDNILDFESMCASELTPPQTPPEQESEIFAQSMIFDNENQQFFDFEIIESSDLSSDGDLPNQNNDSCLQGQEVYTLSTDSTTPFDLNDVIIVNEETSMTYSPNQRFADEMKFVDELVESHSRSQSVGLSTQTSPTWTIQSDATFSPRSECSGTSYSIYDKPKRKVSHGSIKKRSRSRRNPEEKKSRKKEQNKNAATRYRIKKKEEVHVILGEEQTLLDRHRKLSTTFKDTKREVKYLRSLLRELFQARGFIQL